VQPDRAGAILRIGLDGGDAQTHRPAGEADIENGARQIAAAHHPAIAQRDDELGPLDVHAR
jgi:hypothetical protein